MNFHVSVRQDGVILVIDPVVMDAASALGIMGEIRRLAAGQRSRGKPVNVLIDARRLRQSEPSVNKIITEQTVLLDFDRMAIFGVNKMLTGAVNLMFMAAHLIHPKAPTDKIKLFANEEAAEHWLEVSQSVMSLQ